MTKPAADPMSDTPATPTIVERLRAADYGWAGDAVCVDADTAEEGAKEIERLLHQRDALVKALENIKCGAACLPGYGIADAAAEADATLASIKE